MFQFLLYSNVINIPFLTLFSYQFNCLLCAIYLVLFFFHHHPRICPKKFCLEIICDFLKLQLVISGITAMLDDDDRKRFVVYLPFFQTSVV